MYCKYLLYTHIYIYIFIIPVFLLDNRYGFGIPKTPRAALSTKNPEISVFHVCRGDPMVLKVEFQMLFELVTWQNPSSDLVGFEMWTFQKNVDFPWCVNSVSLAGRYRSLHAK